jgi:GDP-mannose transporter
MQVWCCLGLMILSALMGGWSDLTFTLSGYAWQLVNCLFTAAYSLYLSGVIRRVSQQQHDKQQLSELSMVYYNNLLSVPPLAMLSLVSGELWKLRGYQGIWNLEFQVGGGWMIHAGLAV